MSLSTQQTPEVFTWEESTPQVNIVIDQTQKLVGVLSEEWQEKIVSQDERIRELLRLIQEEVKDRSIEFNPYNYYDIAYPTRYLIIAYQFERILNERILKWKLLKHWQEMLSLGDPKIMKQKLLTYCWIDDIVYASLEDSDLVSYTYASIPDITISEFNDRLKNNNWNDLHWVKAIHLHLFIWDLREDVLKLIFKNLIQVKYVWLDHENLRGVWVNELDEIFKYFWWLTWVSLCYDHLWFLWKDELEVISKHLRFVKYIDVRMNDFTDEQVKLIQNLLPDTRIDF